MTTTFKLLDSMHDLDELAALSLLLKKKRGVLDCRGVDSLSDEQINQLFAAIPAEWGFAELGEIIDTATLSGQVAEQLMMYVQQRSQESLTQGQLTNTTRQEASTTVSPVMVSAESSGTLHPIRALNRVIEDYRDYLLAEFRAKDPQLKQALEYELDQPLFLAQEPFFQAHRPFKDGQPWHALPIDVRLARVMENRSKKTHAYYHQSEAIQHLLGDQASPLVVTTGTGSGKSEAFLLPVIQNAIDDAVQFKKAGLTAILLYPMNALANDQLERIQGYLHESGFSGTVTVGQYDRSTSQKTREEYRKNPPHILLTNYMMLEYLLVRPADRDGIFANHRCRFLVLDEVHSYRGTLGSNIALLVRRLRAHLDHARQDWKSTVTDTGRSRRFPRLIPIGTSATIKSVAETDLPRHDVLRLRDEAIQDFFSKLTGEISTSIRVLGEELKGIQVPLATEYPVQPIIHEHIDLANAETVRQALVALADVPPETSLKDAAHRCRLIWDLNRWLISAPMSMQDLVNHLRAETPTRQSMTDADLRREVEAGLLLGAALPEEIPGALRLRVHRFIRGGWQFHRCVSPRCGKLYPMGEERCHCGHMTAPLYLCRNCGADYLRFVGSIDDGVIRPSAIPSEGPEWLLYDYERFIDTVADDDDDDMEDRVSQDPRRAANRPSQMRGRRVLIGSFDVNTLSFSSNETDYALKVMLSPARTRCLCCGGKNGSRSVVSPLSIGTSAAVKVMSEGMVESLAIEHQDWPTHDTKERLLVFSDSRQDAAHQARFIIFASRYDRLRRRLVQILRQYGTLSIQRIVEFLGTRGIEENDNPYAPEDADAWITEERRNRIYAWEEAPLLDEIALNAGYRATVVNLGLVQIRYDKLQEYVHATGTALVESLGISFDHLAYLCRLLLDEIRTRGGLSREMLRYHPLNIQCPDYIRSAEWERRIKEPQGYSMDDAGNPLAYRDHSETIPGITSHNAWRKERTGGRSPSLERICKHLLQCWGGAEPSSTTMVELLTFLKKGSFLIPSTLHGKKNHMTLLQVNEEVVQLHLVADLERLRCDICGVPVLGARVGYPCVRCHGKLVYWPASALMQNRTVRRIWSADVVPLVAGEHTAQVPTEARRDLEDKFKASAAISKVNILACSPTLEMGIDVGGLDAVILRNIPPRPDNYAQRGGRAGRRTRVGLVLGYARSTPHDQYFYDKPTEMIAGEVPAPALALGNRDVLLRHLNAIAFGAADPGLAGKMLHYITPLGVIEQEAVDALIEAVKTQFSYTLTMALKAFGPDILAQARLTDTDLRRSIETLPHRIQQVIDRTARQVQELRQDLDHYAQALSNQRAGTRAAELIARLLGIQTNNQSQQADDRSGGYPLRRFAEFGILPGYEFPTEPSSLRLYRDEHEADPVTVSRQFGIAQFQPNAQVYARAKRWRVVGLDISSPWNPTSNTPGWQYRVCEICKVRFDADNPRCPRCTSSLPGNVIAAAEYAGFLAQRDESPILDEEDRYATRSSIQICPQWDGDVVGRWTVGSGWGLRLSQTERIHWLNEGPPLTQEDRNAGIPYLHMDAKGFLICRSCGQLLTMPKPLPSTSGGRRQANNRQNQADRYGHAKTCPNAASLPHPIAIVATSSCEVLRLILPVPADIQRADIQPWGLSLGYALRAGMRHLYMLDGTEIEFELEGPWKSEMEGQPYSQVSLSFIDPSIGGSGYLWRIADDFHLVAQRAIDHLDHPHCETACYRCLKSYQNQRYHDQLRWVLALPTLQVLASSRGEQRVLQTGDINDPRPWLEAYAAGVGSPLELKFLRLFEANGFYPKTQVPILLDGHTPISTADFALPEERVAIYIDGAAFHVGSNLRRDRFIRDRLRSATPPWRVIELQASDLRKGAALITELQFGHSCNK